MPNLLNDLFGEQVELTNSFNAVPYQPKLIDRLSLFEEGGISTTAFGIEARGDVLSLVQTSPRGGIAQPMRRGARMLREFSTVCLPVQSTIYADEVQDHRAFGGATLETPEELKARVLSQMRTDLEFTIEYHRMGALKGMILDADGSLILDVYSEYGISRQSVSLDMVDAGGAVLSATDIRARVVEAERTCQDALGGIEPTGYLMLVAPDILDAVAGHPRYQQALQYARPESLFDDGRSGIRISNTEIREYRSAPGGPVFLAPGEGVMIPTGVPSLLVTKFAPADYMGTVNQMGLPAYLSAQMGPHEKYVHLEGQSNPLSIATRPAAILQITKAR
jgi:hypothetical protein